MGAMVKSVLSAKIAMIVLAVPAAVVVLAVPRHLRHLRHHLRHHLPVVSMVFLLPKIH
jgi:hypothetical protein